MINIISRYYLVYQACPYDHVEYLKQYFTYFCSYPKNKGSLVLSLFASKLPFKENNIKSRAPVGGVRNERMVESITARAQ